MKRVWIVQGCVCDGPEVFTNPRKAYDYALPMMSKKIAYSTFITKLRHIGDEGTFCWSDDKFDLSVIKKQTNPYQAF